MDRVLAIAAAVCCAAWLLICWGLVAIAALMSGGLYDETFWGFAVTFGALGSPGLLAIPIFGSVQK